MIDFKTAQVRRHQQNLERYCRLLATELTNLQRQYLHKRIAEEYAQLKRLEKAAFRATAWQDDTRVEQMASSSGLAKVSASPASKLGTKPEIHQAWPGRRLGRRGGGTLPVTGTICSMRLSHFYWDVAVGALYP
jgi:hypothetical protein